MKNLHNEVAPMPLHEVQRRAANHITDFKIVMNPTYIPVPFLTYGLDAALMGVVRYLETGDTVNGIQNLIVMFPPRHGKTLTISENLPAFVVGRRPDTHIILTSYGATQAELPSRKARDYVKSAPFRAIFPDTFPKEDLQKAEEWGVYGKHGEVGGMVAVGLGGSIVGKGAHLLIVDDPLKGRAEAENKTLRDLAWNSYTNDFLSRFNDATRAAQIVTAQRYHSDDLIGRILNSPDAKRWAVLRLPALAEENDPLGRKVDESLWPERFPAEYLMHMRDNDPYMFASQYQQRPIPRGDAQFDLHDIGIVDEPPPNLVQVVRFWDLAITTKKRSDFTVGLKLGIDQSENIFVLDVWRGKVNAPDMLDLIVRVARQDGMHVHQVLEGEKIGITQLDYLISDPRLRGYTIKRVPVQGDKLARLSGIAARSKYGKLKIVLARWNKEFLDELVMFPSAPHDDQVDALSGAYIYMTDGQLQFNVQRFDEVRYL